MTLPVAWPVILPGDVDARDDGDSQLAVKFRDRQHLLTECGIELGFAPLTTSGGGTSTIFSGQYRWFKVDAEKLRFVFDALSSDGLTAAQIGYTITPLTGAAVSGSVNTAALGAAYTRTNVVITLNADIRGDHAAVNLTVKRTGGTGNITIAGTQNDVDAVVSRTYWDTDV